MDLPTYNLMDFLIIGFSFLFVLCVLLSIILLVMIQKYRKMLWMKALGAQYGLWSADDFKKRKKEF